MTATNSLGFNCNRLYIGGDSVACRVMPSAFADLTLILTEDSISLSSDYLNCSISRDRDINEFPLGDKYLYIGANRTSSSTHSFFRWIAVSEYPILDSFPIHYSDMLATSQDDIFERQGFVLIYLDLTVAVHGRIELRFALNGVDFDSDSVISVRIVTAPIISAILPTSVEVNAINTPFTISSNPSLLDSLLFDSDSLQTRMWVRFGNDFSWPVLQSTVNKLSGDINFVMTDFSVNANSTERAGNYFVYVSVNHFQFKVSTVNIGLLAPQYCPLISDNFEDDLNVNVSSISSSVVTPNWVDRSEYSISSVCGQYSTTGTAAMVMSALGERFAITRPINLVYGGRLLFNYRYGGPFTGNCPGGFGSQVELQFSTDNMYSWVSFFRFSSTQSGNWFPMNIDIPGMARTATTLLRWYQPAGSIPENRGAWAIDDVKIEVFPPTYASASVTSADISSGPLSGGTVVIIRGQGFEASMQCNFGNEPAVSSVVQSSTVLICISPAVVSPQVVNLRVCGTRFEQPLTFTYYEPPSHITTFPRLVPVGSALITIIGDNFFHGVDQATVRYTVRPFDELSSTVELSTWTEPARVYEEYDILFRSLLADDQSARDHAGFPFGGSRDSRFQAVYLGQELRAMGLMQDDSISSLKVFLSKAPSYNNGQFFLYSLKIYMYHVPISTDLRTTQGVFLQQPFDVDRPVFNGRCYLTQANESQWIEFNFNVTFILADLEINDLVVEFVHDDAYTINPASISPGWLGYRHVLDENRGLKWGGDTSDPYPFVLGIPSLFPWLGVESISIIPRIQFCLQSGCLRKTLAEAPAIDFGLQPVWRDNQIIGPIIAVQFAPNGQQYHSSFSLADEFGFYRTYNMSKLGLNTISPPLGPKWGSTVVTLSSDPGKDPFFEATGSVILLRFILSDTRGVAGAVGNRSSIVNCTYFDAQFFTCLTPSFGDMDTVIVDFSFNGRDFFPSEVMFYFYPIPAVTLRDVSESFPSCASYPQCGPKLNVTLIGDNFPILPSHIFHDDITGSLVLCLFVKLGEFGESLDISELTNNDNEIAAIREGQIVMCSSGSCSAQCEVPSRDYEMEWNIFISFNGAFTAPLWNYHGFSCSDDDCLLSASVRFDGCIAGEYAETYDIPCKECVAGKTSADNSKECNPCDAGTFTPFSGQEFCQECPPNEGTFEPFDFSLLEDFENPPHVNSFFGATSEFNCSCARNFYQNDFDQCLDCPIGAICPGSIDIATGAPTQPYPAFGYYTIADSAIFTECTPAEACRGGPNKDDMQCSIGYKGALCGECANHYYKDNSYCLQCPNANVGAMIAMFICFLGFLYFFALVSPYLKGLGSPRIFMNFVSAAYSFRFFSIQWPEFVDKFFELLNKINININFLQPECQMQISFVAQWYIMQITPFALVLFLFMFYGYQLVTAEIKLRLEIYQLHEKSKRRVVLEKSKCSCIENNPLVNFFQIIVKIIYFLLQITVLLFMTLVSICVLSFNSCRRCCKCCCKLCKRKEAHFEDVVIVKARNGAQKKLEGVTNSDQENDEEASDEDELEFGVDSDDASARATATKRINAAEEELMHDLLTISKPQFDHPRRGNGQTRLLYLKIQYEHVKSMFRRQHDIIDSTPDLAKAKSNQDANKKLKLSQSGDEPGGLKLKTHGSGGTLNLARLNLNKGKAKEVGDNFLSLFSTGVDLSDEKSGKYWLFEANFRPYLLNHYLLRDQTDFEVFQNLQHQINYIDTTKTVENGYAMLGLFDVDEEIRQARVRNDKVLASYLNTTLNALTMLIVFSILPLMEEVFSMFVCTEVVKGTSSLTVYPEITCWTDEHWVIIIPACCFGVLWSFVVPIGLFTHLYQLKIKGELYMFQNKSRFGYLHMRYTADYWYWEFVILVRKMCLSAILIFCGGSSNAFNQISLAFLVFVFFLALHRTCNPFSENLLNLLESMALATLFVVMFIGAIFLTGEIPGDGVESSGVGYSMITVLSFTIFFLGRAAWREFTESLPMLQKLLTLSNIERQVAMAVAELFGTDRGIDTTDIDKRLANANSLQKEHFYYMLELEKRLELVPLFSGIGHNIVTNWLKDPNTPPRDGFKFVSFISKIGKEVFEDIFSIQPALLNTHRPDYATEKVRRVQQYLNAADTYIFDAFRVPLFAAVPHAVLQAPFESVVFLSTDGAHSIQLWQVNDVKSVGRVQLRGTYTIQPPPHQRVPMFTRPNCLRVSPQGLAWAGNLDGSLQSFHTAHMELGKLFPCYHGSSINSIAFATVMNSSQNSLQNFVLTASSDGSLQICAEDGRRVYSSKYLSMLSMANDKVARRNRAAALLKQSESSETANVQDTHTSCAPVSLNCVEVTWDSQYAVTGDDEGKVCFWDLSNLAHSKHFVPISSMNRELGEESGTRILRSFFSKPLINLPCFEGKNSPHKSAIIGIKIIGGAKLESKDENGELDVPPLAITYSVDGVIAVWSIVGSFLGPFLNLDHSINDLVATRITYENIRLTVALQNGDVNTYDFDVSVSIADKKASMGNFEEKSRQDSKLATYASPVLQLIPLPDDTHIICISEDKVDKWQICNPVPPFHAELVTTFPSRRARWGFVSQSGSHLVVTTTSGGMEVWPLILSDSDLVSMKKAKEIKLKADSNANKQSKPVNALNLDYASKGRALPLESEVVSSYNDDKRFQPDHLKFQNDHSDPFFVAHGMMQWFYLFDELLNLNLEESPKRSFQDGAHFGLKNLDDYITSNISLLKEEDINESFRRWLMLSLLQLPSVNSGFQTRVTVQSKSSKRTNHSGFPLAIYKPKSHQLQPAHPKTWVEREIAYEVQMEREKAAMQEYVRLDQERQAREREEFLERKAAAERKLAQDLLEAQQQAQIEAQRVENAERERIAALAAAAEAKGALDLDFEKYQEQHKLAEAEYLEGLAALNHRDSDSQSTTNHVAEFHHVDISSDSDSDRQEPQRFQHSEGSDSDTEHSESHKRPLTFEPVEGSDSDTEHSESHKRPLTFEPVEGSDSDTEHSESHKRPLTFEPVEGSDSDTEHSESHKKPLTFEPVEGSDSDIEHSVSRNAPLTSGKTEVSALAIAGTESIVSAVTAASAVSESARNASRISGSEDISANDKRLLVEKEEAKRAIAQAEREAEERELPSCEFKQPENGNSESPVPSESVTVPSEIVSIIEVAGASAVLAPSTEDEQSERKKKKEKSKKIKKKGDKKKKAKKVKKDDSDPDSSPDVSSVGAQLVVAPLLSESKTTLQEPTILTDVGLGVDQNHDLGNLHGMVLEDFMFENEDSECGINDVAYGSRSGTSDSSHYGKINFVGDLSDFSGVSKQASLSDRKTFYTPSRVLESSFSNDKHSIRTNPSDSDSAVGTRELKVHGDLQLCAGPSDSDVLDVHYDIASDDGDNDSDGHPGVNLVFDPNATPIPFEHESSNFFCKHDNQTESELTVDHDTHEASGDDEVASHLDRLVSYYGVQTAFDHE